MGFIDGKILRLTFLTAVFLPAFLPVLPMDLSAADDTGASVALSDFALPEYRKKDNRLQFILYGDKATNLGAFINLEMTVVVRRRGDRALRVGNADMEKRARFFQLIERKVLSSARSRRRPPDEAP